MRKEQKDLADLGPVEIVRESFKLFWIHPKPLLLILLTFIVPVAILAEVVFVYFGKSAASPLNHSQIGQVFSAHNGSGGFKFDRSLSLVFTMIAMLVIGLALQILQCLSSSTILYAVGLVYTGKTVSFHDVIRAAIPRLWLRLSVTYLYIILLVDSVAIIQLVAVLLSTQANVYVLMMVSFSFLLLVTVGVFFLSMIIIGASGVSVLEKDYGWAAIAKGYRLLQGKKWVVFWFVLLIWVPSFFIGLFQQYILSPGRQDQDDTSTRSWAKLVTSVVILCACSSIYQLFGTLCNSVMYVSCKSFHNESIEDSSLFGEQERRGAYEHIEDLPA